MNRQNRSKLFFRAFFTILAVLALVVIGAFCAYMLWEKAPDISSEAPAQVSAQPVKSDSGSDDTGTAFSTDRQDGVYTVLLVGNDDGNGNTYTLDVSGANVDGTLAPGATVKVFYVGDLNNGAQIVHVVVMSAALAAGNA